MKYYVNGHYLVYNHDWGRRSSETACVRAPASRLVGGAFGYWHHGKKQEAATGAAFLFPAGVDLPNVAE